MTKHFRHISVKNYSEREPLSRGIKLNRKFAHASVRTWFSAGYKFSNNLYTCRYRCWVQMCAASALPPLGALANYSAPLNGLGGGSEVNESIEQLVVLSTTTRHHRKSAFTAEWNTMKFHGKISSPFFEDYLNFSLSLSLSDQCSLY